MIQSDPARERRFTWVVGTCVAITVVILVGLIFTDFATGQSMHDLSRRQDAINIKITAKQWWWQVEYQDVTPSKNVTDANEIHIPVGRPVRFDLNSSDVIHSFWVPNLSGKRDMIPGHRTALYVQADRPGTYYGQCAEFCGYEHAKMRFAVVVQPQAEFDQWLDNARQPAPPPSNELEQRGQQVFLGSTCVMCHSISGTSARGMLGPDLTHLASRQTIAAGSLPNSRGHIAGWVLDPQNIKPGVLMPQHNFNPDDLQALLEYLWSLK
jgi:cytochrome c oxidase subunit 2